MDYVVIDQQITIPAGDTQASLVIPIINDNVHENTESFTVQIATIPGVTPPQVTTTTPNRATVEITDNDGN